jgi:hypothetical protein
MVLLTGPSVLVRFSLVLLDVAVALVYVAVIAVDLLKRF